MKDKMKKILTNRFAWNVAAAICGIGLACCYIIEEEDILAILWAICSGCNIALAWLERKGE